MISDWTAAGTAVFVLSLRAVVASITALRDGDTPPETIWTPDAACGWDVRLGRRPDRAGGPTPGEATAYPIGEAVCEIRHGSDPLARSLERTAGRTLRMMAWTLDEVVPWSGHTGTRWRRVTVDDVVHAGADRVDGRWVSWLTGPYPSLSVEVVEPPLGFGDRGATAAEAPQLPLQGHRGGGVAPGEA